MVQPAALAATLLRGKRGAAHPATLSPATRLTRLSAAAEAAAAGAGDHGSGSIGSLQDFRRRMAAHLRGLPPSQGASIVAQSCPSKDPGKAALPFSLGLCEHTCDWPQRR